MSRLLSVVHQKASSTLIASYTYDARGNRTSVTDALQDPPTSCDDDVMNRLKKITQPGNATTQFVYDTRGRRTSVTDPNNKTTQYGYDDARACRRRTGWSRCRVG